MYEGFGLEGWGEVVVSPAFAVSMSGLETQLIRLGNPDLTGSTKAVVDPVA